jgi:hypothetical protein
MQATQHQSALASDVWLGLSTCGCCHFCEAVINLDRLSLERATLAPEPRSNKRYKLLGSKVRHFNIFLENFQNFVATLFQH